MQARPRNAPPPDRKQHQHAPRHKSAKREDDNQIDIQEPDNNVGIVTAKGQSGIQSRISRKSADKSQDNHQDGKFTIP